ncbi:MAG: hypothetical protein KDB23_34595, partial [Planctomycetales bacterium]|nr:hypothetical protein [Planctomycetales bacterium]
SEELAAQVGKQLNELAMALHDDAPELESRLAQISTDRFVGVSFPESALAVIYDQGNFRALRLPRDFNDFATVTSLSEQLRLLLPRTNSEDVHAKFKVVHIEQLDDKAVATVRFEGSTNSAQLAQQFDANLELDWQVSDALPRLSAVKILTYDRVTLATIRPWFDDVT